MQHDVMRHEEMVPKIVPPPSHARSALERRRRHQPQPCQGKLVLLRAGRSLSIRDLHAVALQAKQIPQLTPSPRAAKRGGPIAAGTIVP